MMSSSELAALCILLVVRLFALYHRFSIVREVRSFHCDAG
jgi:hypothetical protein